MKIFCLNCNHGSSYENGIKPTFCSKCGKPYIDKTINQAAAIIKNEPIFAITNNRQANPKQNNVTDDDGDDDENIKVPKLDKIECNITSDNYRPNRQSAEAIFKEGLANGPNSASIQRPRIKARKLSKKEMEMEKIAVAEQFRKEFNKNGRNNRNSTEIE